MFGGLEFPVYLIKLGHVGTLWKTYFSSYFKPINEILASQTCKYDPKTHVARVLNHLWAYLMTRYTII